jgi:hypothetical protein
MQLSFRGVCAEMSLSFGLMGIRNELLIVKICTEINHKCTHYLWNTVCNSVITNAVIVQNVRVMPNKFRICRVQWSTEFCSKHKRSLRIYCSNSCVGLEMYCIGKSVLWILLWTAYICWSSLLGKCVYTLVFFFFFCF